MRTKRSSRLALAFLAATFVSCYDPAVRERVVLTLGPQGRSGVLVETFFKPRKDLTPQELLEIQDVLDRYDQGRDPWLRGFERAGAAGITHACKGISRNTESIRREADLPSAEALVKAMPDAIANISLRGDEARHGFTLSVVHIDQPETIRDNRRRLEREIAAWSKSVYRLSSRQCDLYDYLAEQRDRRRAVLSVMTRPAAIQDVLEPREAALLERLAEALESAGNPPASRSRTEPGGEPPAITRMSFCAFDHDLCVRLPSGAHEVTASPGLVQETGPDSLETWCFERLSLEELGSRLSPQADPPWSAFDEGLPGDPALIEQAPFTCQRYDDARDVERKAWEEILPKAFYEVTWTAATTPTSSP